MIGLAKLSTSVSRTYKQSLNTIPVLVEKITVFKQRCYHDHKSAKYADDVQYVVDLRSDTVTKPSAGMRQAMANAEVGDDVMGEDPTVNVLQERIAALFGKEAALFVPTGTMGNLVSAMTHCNERGLEAILGHKSHMLVHEQGNIAQFGGILSSVVENNPDGTMDITKVKERIRVSDDPHFPYTRLICVENTHNYCGGKVVPLSFLQEIKGLAMENGLKVHMDGARIMHAVTALGVTPSEILQYTDSINMCFSKGLSCPVGSIIAGEKAFIEKAKRVRKALGGGMRQVGVLAAAALHSLDTVLPRLHEDHTRTKAVVQALMSRKNELLQVDVGGVHTNIVFVNIIKPGVTATDVYNRLLQVPDVERHALGESIIVKTVPYTDALLRFVLHNDVSADDVTKAITKFCYVVDEYSSS